LPLCLWILASYLSELGPEKIYWLVTQNANDGVRKIIDRAQLIGLCLSAGGLIAGGLLVWLGRRRGVREPVACWALVLGIVGVSLVGIGVLAMIVSFMAWDGPA
jgi:peptidoglycan biosynthesis protein MviN/MurJ (putative lipid II flippase)